MKLNTTVSLLCMTGLVLAWPANAGDKPGKGNQKHNAPAVAPAPAPIPPPPNITPPPSKEPWVSANVRFTPDERRVMTTYAHEYVKTDERSLARKRLPPGLSKKAARGRELPPAWEQKCVPGKVMPPEVIEQSHPIPRELAVKLPPPPPDTMTITVGGKVVRLIKATSEILDVFDVHLGL